MKFLKTFLIFLTYGLLFSLNGEHKDGEIIIRYNDKATALDKNRTATDFNLIQIDSIKFNNSVLYKFDHNQSTVYLQKSLEGLSCVKYVTFNSIYKQLSLDPDFGEQWYLENTGQSIRWVTGTPGIDIGWKSAVNNLNPIEDVFVAVMDSGFAKNHIELNNGITLQSITELNGIAGEDDDGNGYRDDVDGWDFVENEPDPYDLHGHGTQVAGIIAGAVNGVGIQGVSQNVGIKPIRVADAFGVVDMWNVAKAVLYISARNNFRIINLSLGGPTNNPYLDEVLEYLETKNEILVICAAGNGGTDKIGDNNDFYPYYPASYDYDNIISVASIDQTGQLSSFSNFGSESVDIAAPGENIFVATVEREVVEVISPSNIWKQEVFLDSSGNWEYFPNNGVPFLMSPPTGTFSWAASITSPYINLKDYEDPRIAVNLYKDLKTPTWLRIRSSKVIQELDFLIGGDSSWKYEFFDISNFKGEEVRLVFDFTDYHDLGSLLGIGNISIIDVTTASSLKPHYEYQKGTSFSAPIVSGVAAMIFSSRPDLLASDVKEILLNSVTKLNNLGGKVKSGGMVRADKAIELANTYRKRSSVEFLPTYNQELTSDLKVKINDIYLTYQQMTAGVLDGQGHYFEGDSITLSAVPEVGFNFEGWEENGIIISNDETYTFTSEFKDYIFKAIFSEDLSDPDNDEFPNYAEAIYGTNISDPNSDNDALNDYDEWQVAWYGSSLDLLEDDSEKISLLEQIIGADLYDQGIAKVLNEPASYSLIPKSVYSQALLDANETAEQAIADAKVASKSEGIVEGKTLVISNPASYSLVSQSVYNQAIESAKKTAREEASKDFQDIFQNQDSNATPYTRDWFYMPERGWMWTKPKIFPWLYDKKSSNWMYFKSSHDNPRFYHYGTKEWMTLD